MMEGETPSIFRYIETFGTMPNTRMHIPGTAFHLAHQVPIAGNPPGGTPRPKLIPLHVRPTMLGSSTLLLKDSVVVLPDLPERPNPARERPLHKPVHLLGVPLRQQAFYGGLLDTPPNLVEVPIVVPEFHLRGVLGCSVCEAGQGGLGVLAATSEGRGDNGRDPTPSGESFWRLRRCCCCCCCCRCHQRRHDPARPKKVATKKKQNSRKVRYSSGAPISRPPKKKRQKSIIRYNIIRRLGI